MAIASVQLMINRIFSTLGGKAANERKLDIVSNNVANALTPGFKATRPVFSVAAVGRPTDPGELQQTYVNIADSYVHFSDAPFVETSNPFDLAIEGAGFFVVSTPKGDRYTRNGQFTLDSNKRLVTADGNPVMGQSGGEMTIEGKDIKIESDGSIFADGVQVDTVKVVDFADKRSLRSIGRSLFENTDSKNTETTSNGYSVKQGAYEASNVDIMKEMVELINTLRAYEAYTKVDQMAGDVLQKLVELGKY